MPPQSRKSGDVPPAAPTDSSPVVNDPLRDLSPYPDVKVGYASEDDIPPDVRDFLEVSGIPNHAYRCILKRIPEGWSDKAQAPYVASWPNTFPSIEFIAKEYGPGEYLLIFQWRGRDPETTKVKNFSAQHTVYVDESHRDEYDEYQLRKSIARNQRQQRLVEAARVRNELVSSLSGPARQQGSEKPVDKVEAGKQYIQDTVQAAEMLGLTKREGMGWDKILAIVLPMLPSLIEGFSRRASAESDKLERIYAMLMAQQSESTKQLIEVLKVQQGPGNGSETMKEMRDMIFGAIDIKEALAGGKTSIGDRIFELIQGVAPHVIELAMKNKESRETDPRFAVAQAYVKAAPEFKEMAKNPAVQADVTHRLDGFFGWEQADLVLQVMGFTRPESCPRVASQRYPNGDDRNKGTPEPPKRKATPAAPAISEPIDGEIIESDEKDE